MNGWNKERKKEKGLEAVVGGQTLGSCEIYEVFLLPIFYGLRLGLEMGLTDVIAGRQAPIRRHAIPLTIKGGVCYQWVMSTNFSSLLFFFYPWIHLSGKYSEHTNSINDPQLSIKLEYLVFFFRSWNIIHFSRWRNYVTQSPPPPPPHTHTHTIPMILILGNTFSVTHHKIYGFIYSVEFTTFYFMDGESFSDHGLNH